MNRINNVEELREEITRLRKRSAEQKQHIKNDVNEIGESLKPANLFYSFMSSVTGIRVEKNEFLKNGILLGLALLLQRYVLSSETKIGHKIYEWVDSVLNKIKDFMNRHKESSASKENL